MLNKRDYPNFIRTISFPKIKCSHQRTCAINSTHTHTHIVVVVVAVVFFPHLSILYLRLYFVDWFYISLYCHCLRLGGLLTLLAFYGLNSSWKSALKKKQQCTVWRLRWLRRPFLDGIGNDWEKKNESKFGFRGEINRLPFVMNSNPFVSFFSRSPSPHSLARFFLLSHSVSARHNIEFIVRESNRIDIEFLVQLTYAISVYLKTFFYYYYWFSFSFNYVSSCALIFCHFSALFGKMFVHPFQCSVRFAFFCCLPSKLITQDLFFFLCIQSIIDIVWSMYFECKSK